ncbi:MAG TPA: hypothetical protein VFK02_26975 [Kofleriaceae bacterium]|nr:hypothetical protein [Kofleriaceae bacterium]
MMRARWLPLLIVIAAGAPRAQAQSASTQAQSLFDDGQRQMKAGKVAEACAAFERSEKLEPVVTTQLNLADCRERNHQLATAWSAFLEADRMAQAIGDARLARVAQSHARKLEPRLSRLTISIPADRLVPGLEVLRGSDRVLSAVWNHAVPVDGGTYTITARANGFGSWSVAKSIKDEADAQTVEIPKLIEATAVWATPRPGEPVAPSPVVAGGPSSASPAKSGSTAASPAKSGGTASPVTSGKPGGPTAASPPGKASGTAAPASSASAPAPGTASSSGPPVAPASPASGGTTVAIGAEGTGRRGPDVPPHTPGSPPAGTTRPVAPTPPSPARDEHVESPPATPSPGPDEPPGIWHTYKLPIAVGAGALVLGGVALAFNSSGDSAYDQAKHAPTQGDQDSLYKKANQRRYFAEAFAGAAVGCAGAAVYLYVRSRGEHREETTALMPVASPDLAGLAVTGTW